jgi:hypothetical protein
MDMKKLLVMLLLLYPLSASGLTYEWTDDAGTVNFTEDLGKVPKKYRKRAKVLGADETGAPQIIESSEPAKGKAKESGVLQDKKAPSAKDEALRKEYEVAKANLEITEDELTDLRARMNDTSKMSRAEYLAIQNSLKQGEFRAQEQRKKLNQLRDSARKAGVALDQK